MAAYERVPPYVAWRFEALTEDVAATLEWLGAAYVAAATELEAYKEWLRAQPPTPIGQPPSTDGLALLQRQMGSSRLLQTAVKTAFVFLRAYQDAAYGVLIELAGARAGPSPRMANAFNETNPVGELLREHLPGYIEWLPDWRQDRDKIKLGANFSVVWDAENRMELSFVVPTDEGIAHEERTISFDRILEAVEMSRRLREVIESQGAAT